MKAESPAELILPACPLLTLGNLALPLLDTAVKELAPSLWESCLQNPTLLHSEEMSPPLTMSMGELALNAWAQKSCLHSSPKGKQTQCPRLTSSITTQTHIQSCHLVHLNIYPIVLLQQVKGIVLWNDIQRISTTRGGYGIFERSFNEGLLMMVCQMSEALNKTNDSLQ